MHYSGSWDIFLLKYNSTGALLWTNQTGTTDDDRGYGVSVSSDGYIYVTGVTAGNLNGHISAGIITTLNLNILFKACTIEVVGIYFY